MGGSESGTLQEPMNYPVIIRPEADQEILSARDHYDGIDNELGNDVRASIAECINRIREHPELYACLYCKVRPVTLRRFPFILSYVFENERVVVLGLVHSSLPHEAWNRRK